MHAQVNHLRHPRAMEFEGATVSVHYKDRMSEIKLNLAGNTAHRDQEVVSLALNLQAALNLATPPIGLRLRVAPGTEAVVCPLSVLVACPSYIATTFQGECGCWYAFVHVQLMNSQTERFTLWTRVDAFGVAAV